MDDDYKSRSQKKRESTAMQKMGEELATLAPSVWNRLPLSPDLLAALQEHASMKGHETKRRHMQYIGRVMREHPDPEALLAAFAAEKDGQHANARAFHHLEDIRAKLLHAEEAERETALQETLARFPRADAAKLKHLIQGALAEKQNNRPPRFTRELFRFLRTEEERLLPQGEE